MSRLITTPRAAHVHREWDSQPLVRSTPKRRSSPMASILIAFFLGLVAGLLF